jgi:hypothetical protein
MATTGKIAEIMFDKVLDTYNEQETMVKLTTLEQPDPGAMQNSGNVVWRPVQQHAPIIDGWDLTGKETGIIEETYPAVLGIPKNDFVEQRADDLRDSRFWERRGVQSAMQQVTELNKLLAAAIATQGSLFYESTATSGYDFIAEAQALMNERQAMNNGRCFVLNDRDTLTFGKDLAARQTLQGRPNEVWEKGQIGANVAEFDVYTGSYLPNLAGGVAVSTTVTGNQTFAPTGGTVNATTLAVTNTDYRTADIPVAASAGYNVGDKVTFNNAGTLVKSVGLADKNATNQAMTFSIVGKPDGTTITVFPKPIAADDAALSTLEKAYANIDTTILNAATVDRVNTLALNKTNLFWDKQAVEVLGGTIPADLFASFDGNKVLTETMANGLQMYMVYDGDIATMNFRYRIFTWYGITIANPSNCGVALTI